MRQKSKHRSASKGGLVVGGKVYVQFGNKRRMATIVEDRGTIGRDGRRLLRVELTRPGEAAEQVFEVPADAVTRAETPQRPAHKTKPKVA
jgi:hypothetical protein